MKVYTTEVVVENQEFAESKNTQGNGGYANAGQSAAPAPMPADDGFMNIPDGIEELPFS